MNTPVLLLAYNRPTQLIRVLTRLQECGATQIYVSQDGPKNFADKERVKLVNEALVEFDSIIVKRQHSTTNSGCKKAVVNGINWFFSQVEEGIILEDDCLPNATFFSFCTELLHQYRNEDYVQMISGNNPLGHWDTKGSHFFSRIGHIWGWATWKTSWKRFNPELPTLLDFEAESGFEKAFGPTLLAKTRKNLTNQSVDGFIDTWDYQWNAHLLMLGGAAAVPCKNLVENIGFDEDGTHTPHQPRWLVNDTFSESLNNGPVALEISREYEMELFLAQKSNSQAHNSHFNFESTGKSSAQKLRIIHINTTDIGGGAEKIALNIHHQLLLLGHESCLLVSTKKLDEDEIKLLSNDWMKQVLEFKPDVIHVHNLHGTSVSLKGLTELSKTTKVLWTLHDSWLTTGSVSHPFLLEASGLSLLDRKGWKTQLSGGNELINGSQIRFTAPSNWMRERFFFKHNKRSYLVPNGITKIVGSKIEIVSKRYALFIANKPETNPYKDFESLKSAWEKANVSLSSPIDLVCIGASSNSTTKTETGTLHLVECQSADNVMAYINSALFVIHASKQDNAPLAILEAHLLNKPVVASLVGGIPELPSNMEQHWLCAPKDSDALTDSIIAATNTIDAGKNTEKLPIPTSVEAMTDTYLGHYLNMING